MLRVQSTGRLKKPSAAQLTCLHRKQEDSSLVDEEGQVILHCCQLCIHLSVQIHLERCSVQAGLRTGQQLA